MNENEELWMKQKREAFERQRAGKPRRELDLDMIEKQVGSLTETTASILDALKSLSAIVNTHTESLSAIRAILQALQENSSPPEDPA